MKKTLIIGITSLVLTSPGYALYKCVRLDATRIPTSGANVQCMDWWVKYSDGQTVNGVAVCSSQYPGFGYLATELVDSGDGVSNTACYCKMTTPAVSLWISNGNYPTQYDCRVDCAANCVQGMKTSNTLRTAMFSNLYD